MRPQTEAVYVKAADLGSLPVKVKPSVQVQTVTPEAYARLGSTALIGRYHHEVPHLYWETNSSGRSVWMMSAMHRILLAVRSELEAERTLHTVTIATLAGVSKGYVSKALHWLDRFGFITILGSWKGRWGGIVAKLKVNVSTIRERLSSTGGNIDRIKEAWRVKYGADADLAALDIRTEWSERAVMAKPWTLEELDW